MGRDRDRDRCGVPEPVDTQARVTVRSPSVNRRAERGSDAAMVDRLLIDLAAERPCRAVPARCAPDGTGTALTRINTAYLQVMGG